MDFEMNGSVFREWADRALVIVLFVKAILRLQNAIRNSVSEASKLVSTETLFLKHYYRRQGFWRFKRFCLGVTARRRKRGGILTSIGGGEGFWKGRLESRAPVRDTSRKVGMLMVRGNLVALAGWYTQEIGHVCGAVFRIFCCFFAVFGERSLIHSCWQTFTEVCLSAAGSSWHIHISGRFKGGGLRKGGCSHLLASTLSVRAAGPSTILSHKCNILSLLNDDRIACNNRLPVHCRHLRSLRHRTVIPVATQMSLPHVCLPPV